MFRPCIAASIFLLALITISNSKAQSLIKGPYLLNLTSHQVLIKWETDSTVNTALYWKKKNALSWDSVRLLKQENIHQFLLTKLDPFTEYTYNIGTTDTILSSGSNNYFVTAPSVGTGSKYRFWVTGDCGNHSVNQENVRNSFMYYATNRPFHGWLLLGDNAYYNGTDQEYNTNFFEQYQSSVLPNLPLWPAPGNHEYANNPALQQSKDIAYCKIFNTPQAGECGGVPSKSPTYYSYDFDNIHFLSLDSYGLDSGLYRLYDTAGPQVQWIKQDLTQNKKMWTIAYWHHPPYSMGSHNSDAELELVELRKNFIQILERYGVDLILCGHSHLYERSRLMYGYYGMENEFDSSKHLIDPSAGHYDKQGKSCAYTKRNNQDKGTIYIVAGSAGSLGGIQPSFPHDAMYYSKYDIGGSLLIEIEKNRADIKWLGADSIVYDSFTIFKNVNQHTTYYVQKNQELLLNASWEGQYRWNLPSQPPTRSCFTKLNSNAAIIVSDTLGCLADTFSFILLPDITSQTDEPAKDANQWFSLRFNPIDKTIHISLFQKIATNLSYALYDLTGKKITQSEIQIDNSISIDLKRFELPPREYLFELYSVQSGSHSIFRIMLQ